jgi:hypothetical protein
MKQDMLSYVDQVGVANIVMLLTMSGDVCWRRGALSTQCGLCRSSGSRHFMFATCGPRDIISLVIPRLGGNKAEMRSYTMAESIDRTEE